MHNSNPARAERVKTDVAEVLALAALGYKVLPFYIFEGGSKVPASRKVLIRHCERHSWSDKRLKWLSCKDCTGGAAAATSSPTAVRFLWQKRPEALVGGILPEDTILIDDDHHVFDEQWAGEARVRSQSGKHHRYFQLAPGQDGLRSENGIDYTGNGGYVDIRVGGDMSYFVGIPCGREEYQGVDGWSPDRVTWDWLPQDVYERLRVAPRRRPKGHGGHQGYGSGVAGVLEAQIGYQADQDQEACEELLLEAGWTRAGGEHWTRPGKDAGTSGTLKQIDEVWYFYNFSAAPEAEPLAPDAWYTPSMLRCVLVDGGDWDVTRTALAAAGEDLTLGDFGVADDDEETPANAAVSSGAEAATNVAACEACDLLGQEYCDEHAEAVANTTASTEERAVVVVAPADEGGPLPPAPTSEGDRGPWPKRHQDAYVAEWLAHVGLKGDWLWAGGIGWLHWDGKIWKAGMEEDVREAARLAFVGAVQAATAGGISVDKLGRLVKLLSKSKMDPALILARGVLSVPAGDFDAHPDLLSVNNGVVDLRTGALLPHDRKLLLTKTTPVDYVPGARHADWDKVLTCLEEESMSWMHARLGQAITGYPTSDDVLPIGQGGGSNGKSTLLAGCFGALGDHITLVPEKLLRAGPNDHPTELMTLRGVRVAIVDETPEAAQLNIPRLKAVLGTKMMTAREVFKNNVSWKASHSLLVMTNYKPLVAETDHGTWRRLAMVIFGKTFPKDERFRDRVTEGRQGQHVAALAWLVEGAKRWYDNERALPEMPKKVEEDTRDWRLDSDLVLAFNDDEMVVDPDAAVLSTDVVEALNKYLRSKGQATWSSKLAVARIEGHKEFKGVKRRAQINKVSGDNDVEIAHAVIDRVEVPLMRHVESSTATPSARATVWHGVRFRTAGDVPAATNEEAV